MGLRTKVIIVFLAGLVLYLGITKAGEAVKEKYIYKFIAHRIQSHFEKKCQATLHIGKISGNIFTNLRLQNISLADFKEYPGDLQFNAESVNITYTLFDILIGRRFKAEFAAPRIKYNKVLIPLEINHFGKITTIVIKRNRTQLSDFKELLPKDIFLEGQIDSGGELILKGFRPHLLNIYLKAPDIQARSQPGLRAKGAVYLELSGRSDRPQISGNIKLTQIYLPQGLISISSLRTQKPDIESGFFKNSTLNINISGDEIVVQNHNLKAHLDASLILKKDGGGKPFLLGKAEIIDGTYQAHGNRFHLTGGQILFTEKFKGPLIEAEAETKVRRYRIFAKVKGTIDDSRLILTSRPELTHAEIVSLLAFGKRVKDLSIQEKEELSGADFNNILINNIFLGKAEVKLAESAGLDDINISLDAAGGSPGKLKVPSLEVGKYIAGEKLYGTYSLKAKDKKTNLPEQTAGAEMELTDNITLKGKRHWQESWMAPKEDRLDIEFKWKF